MSRVGLHHVLVQLAAILFLSLGGMPWAGSVWALPIDGDSAAQEVPPVDQPVQIATPASALKAPLRTAVPINPGRTFGEMMLTAILVLVAAASMWKVVEKSRRTLTRHRHRRRGYYKVRY
jgi:hypothetical protein